MTLGSDKTIVYGIVMDWDVGQAVATVVAFQTGDASLYLSSGQIYIGGRAHDNIKRAGLIFVNEAQNYLSKAAPTDTAALPDKGYVRFYLLTNKGKYTFEETVANIESKKSDCAKLFELGDNVITEYRKTTEK